MDQEKIIGMIKEKFGSLENPNRGFIDQIFASEAYLSHYDSPLMKQLAKSFDITLDEQTYYDHGYRYELKTSEHDFTINLLLSFLGNYAVAYREYTPGHPNLLVGTLPATEKEKILIKTLEQNGYIILPSDLLTTPLKINLRSVGSEAATIYSALFSDSPIPWSNL